MKRRNLIQMTEDEVQAFLQQERTLQVATIGRDGYPHLVAMWFALLNGEIAFWTYAKSQKAVNLRRDPRLTCLAEAGETYPELRGVQIKGRAQIIEDTSSVQQIGEMIWQRMTGPLNENISPMVESQAAKRIAVIVRPVEIVSWDHRKIRGY
jgi:PPOX class probable F420-dependent enzyme